MQTELRTDAEPGMAALIGDIVGDAQNLIKQELALAKCEIAGELRKTKEAAISLGIGIGVSVLGAVLLVLMVVHYLNWATVGAIPLWACYGIVGGTLGILGGALFYVGKHQVSKIHLPTQTAEMLKENVQWINKQS